MADTGMRAWPTPRSIGRTYYGWVVLGVAALAIASGVLGRRPSPDAIEAHLKATARDLGPHGPDQSYGAGLVDGFAATTPAPPA